MEGLVPDESLGDAAISFKRDRASGAIRECNFVDCDGELCSAAPGDTVLVAAAADSGQHPFVGFVRKYVEVQGEVQAEVRWFYRRADVLEAGGELEGRLVLPAQLSRRRGGGGRGLQRGGEQGHFREIYFANHTGTVDCRTFIHPVKVWCLPDDDLTPLQLPPPPGGATVPATETAPPAPTAATAATAVAFITLPPAATAAATAAAPRGPAALDLLPGFVCRQMFDVTNRSMVPLGRVAGRKAADQAAREYQEDLALLLRRTEAALPGCRAEWQQRRAALAERAARALRHRAVEEVVGGDDEEDG